MKKFKFLLFFAAITMTAMVVAQGVQHPQYVVRESQTQKFYTQYTNWTAGTTFYSDAAADDEEFFISRVKPKVRFSNQATQVNTALDGQRKMLWWCPMGASDWNALPTYYFNSEVFSMWSYLDHYGNWTAPFIRQPGAFTDACHKNGVVNSVVAAIGFGASISPTEEYHGKNINAIATGGADKLLSYLKYYGIDGLGFNSEFNFSDATFRNRVNTLFVDAFKKKNAAGVPMFSMAWYSLTNNNGSISGANWDSLNDGNSNWFHNGGTVSNNFFLNYNWGSALLNSSQQKALSFPGRSSYDVYAGMDFQGRNRADWTALQNYNISIGMWGAHNMNMIYESRGESGSEAAKQQEVYQAKSELIFTGGSRNPVNTPAVSNYLGYGLSSTTQFHGISKFLNARSTLQTTDLAKEPFVTYFNLGNGKFFKSKGQTTNTNEWYNIGMQDYLPTWRWWLTSTFMGRTAGDVPAKGITPSFTWEDAWFGGSCLKVTGQTEGEYLHLFKTKFPVEAGDQLTIRYKLQQGNGEVQLACSAEGTESQEVRARAKRDSETETGVWVEKVIKVGARTGELNLAGKTMALMALKFENTTPDFSILIGEVSLKRAAATTPNKPTITKSTLLATNFKGVDFKLIYKMKDRPAGSALPIYNEDVDVWYYKVYSQQMNEEPVLCTATTSWASYVVGASFKKDADKDIRFGVSAVSLDGNSESEIAWTGYVTTGTAAVVEGIELDKPVIKADETFTVRYKDPNHVAAKRWEILNAQTEVSVKVITNAKEITTSLPNVGLYDLALTADVVTEGVSKEETFIYRGLIQISGPEVGALPEVKELKANNQTTTIDATAPATVSYDYVGRAADGTVSRALRIPEKPFAIQASQLGLNDQSPFSICFWFKANKFTHGNAGTQLLNIRTLDDAWPASDWGYVWSTIGTNNTYALSVRRTSNAGTEFKAPNFVFLPNQWTHIAFVVDWKNGRKISLFANGKKIGESEIVTDLYPFKQSNYIMIGGVAFGRAGLDGFLDEFQFYKKALTPAEVLNSMQHQTTIPEGLLGYWDFETDTDDSNKMMSTGTDKAIYAGIQDFAKSAPLQPTSFGPGVPFIQGSKYEITTTADWNLEGAEITTQATGTGEAGNVAVKYLNNGLYRATLTLKNGWGSDTKTFEFVKVGGSYQVDYSVLPAYIHPNNVKLYYANVGSSTFEPLVSGQSYPDGSTIRMMAKPVTLDGVSSFQKWTINGMDNLSANVDITLNSNQIISANFVPFTGLFSPNSSEWNFVASPNPFVNEVHVQFVKDGKFSIEVMNINGQLVSMQQAEARNGEFVRIAVNGAQGMYLINIKENGQLIKSLKVLKK